MIFAQTLGPPVLRLADGSVPPNLQWRKNLALLVYLGRSPTRSRSRDHLQGLLWGDQPQEKARGSLNQALMTLRAYLEDKLESDRSQVRLLDGALRLDIDEVEALARAGDYEGAARPIVGLFLEGFLISGASEFDDWKTAEQLHWQRRSVDILMEVATHAFARGDLRGAAEAATRAGQIDPHSDVATQARMRVLALSGDPGAALAEFHAFSARLRRDVGTEPVAETRGLAGRIQELAGRHPAHELRLATPPESRLPLLAPAPLVGRAAELAELGAAWLRAVRGEVTFVLIEGEGGTGKSRLASEVAARARLDGGAVVMARVVEADQREPWSGVLGVARGGLLGSPGIAGVAPATLAQLRGEAPVASARALSDGLRAVAEEQPLLVIFDDAHWLDRESLLAVAAAARDLSGARVLLLLATSPQRRRAELDEIRARLGRDVPGTVVALRPLTADQLRELARWAAPGFDAVQLERLARRIVADSAGIPLLAVELLKAVAAGLDLAALRGAWPAPLKTLEQTLPGDLPDAITAAVRVNFHRLSTGAQAVLKVAAVLQARVSDQLLARVTGSDGAAVGAALDELEAQRWLAADARGYSFVARIMRDVVDRDMVLAGERQRIVAAAQGFVAATEPRG